MGNCLLGTMSDQHTLVKIITSDGNIMEFYPPITVNFITNEFHGHAIFTTNDQFSKPLSQFDELVAGQSYYLLPMTVLSSYNKVDCPSIFVAAGCQIIRQGHVRSQSVPTTPLPAPYRMSLDYQYYQGVGLLKRASTESLSCRTNSSSGIKKKTNSSGKNIGVWKVKLCITPEKLLEILSQESQTKELIESVRIVAKCGVAAAASSGGYGISSRTSFDHGKVRLMQP
ncbi:hypothetical protein TSUD_290220 [Trifolium subterraneum]|uniref:DUF4228 domain-containing protein n=1 Tax=Trifolium subterraneum TaxID=3900 RepID=A0A2Z6NU76_TRISU|nr:hypothetical protein TSUD_290220 [Trifolium subterraneum]